METKSRYEVMTDLQATKQTLMRQKLDLDQEVLNKERDIKNHKRALEDKEEDLMLFKAKLGDKKVMLDSLIKSTEESIAQLQQMSQSGK